MSSIWDPSDIAGAARVGGFDALAKAGRAPFRSRYGASGDGAGWHPARGQTPDAMPDEPQEDPIERLQQEAFVMGFQEGERVTREAAQADDAARLALAEALVALTGAGEGALAAMLSQAVLRLVGQIMGEVAVDEALLAERCAAVAACIDPDDAKSVLEVNPADLPLIEPQGLGVQLAPNPSLSRGSVRLATADGWIEDGPDVRLDRLKALMDDMEGRA